MIQSLIGQMRREKKTHNHSPPMCHTHGCDHNKHSSYKLGASTKPVAARPDQIIWEEKAMWQRWNC